MHPYFYKANQLQMFMLSLHHVATKCKAAFSNMEEFALMSIITGKKFIVFSARNQTDRDSVAIRLLATSHAPSIFS